MLSTAVSGTEVYKWTDATGHVHFGDKPEQANSQSVLMHPLHDSATAPATTTNERRERTQRLLNEYAQDREERRQTEARDQQALNERRRTCTQAKAHLFELENSGYMYDRDANGQKIILPDSEFRKAKEDARRRVASVCKGEANHAPSN